MNQTYTLPSGLRATVRPITPVDLLELHSEDEVEMMSALMKRALVCLDEPAIPREEYRDRFMRADVYALYLHVRLELIELRLRELESGARGC